MVAVTAEKIKTFAPNARDDLVQAIVTGWPAAEQAGINTPLRAQHFFAQIATETGGFKAIEENLNYTAKRLNVVFPKRFPTVAAAEPFAKNPEKLANKVYGGRLGNDQDGDGWRYRGSGFIQTTGRSNFRQAGFENSPDDLRKPAEGFGGAIIFWSKNGLNALADTDDIVKVRKRVNGGINGLDEARKFLKKAKSVFV